jgi:protein translocase SecG subunit
MDWIAIIQIVLSVVLIVLILMQRNDASVGAAFGSDNSGLKRTRRGAERAIFLLTVAVAIAYAVMAVVSLLK